MSMSFNPRSTPIRSCCGRAGATTTSRAASCTTAAITAPGSTTGRRRLPSSTSGTTASPRSSLCGAKVVTGRAGTGAASATMAFIAMPRLAIARGIRRCHPDRGAHNTLVSRAPASLAATRGARATQGSPAIQVVAPGVQGSPVTPAALTPCHARRCRPGSGAPTSLRAPIGRCRCRARGPIAPATATPSVRCRCHVLSRTVRTVRTVRATRPSARSRAPIALTAATIPIARNPCLDQSARTGATGPSVRSRVRGPRVLTAAIARNRSARRRAPSVLTAAIAHGRSALIVLARRPGRSVLTEAIVRNRSARRRARIVPAAATGPTAPRPIARARARALTEAIALAPCPAHSRARSRARNRGPSRVPTGHSPGSPMPSRRVRAARSPRSHTHGRARGHPNRAGPPRRPATVVADRPTRREQGRAPSGARPSLVARDRR
jgi:hypothetical protein